MKFWLDNKNISYEMFFFYHLGFFVIKHIQNSISISCKYLYILKTTFHLNFNFIKKMDKKNLYFQILGIKSENLEK